MLPYRQTEPREKLLIERAIDRIRNETVGLPLSRLLFINTIVAAIGRFYSGYIIIETFQKFVLVPNCVECLVRIY